MGTYFSKCYLVQPNNLDCAVHSCPVLPAFVSGTPDYPLCMQRLMEYSAEDPMSYVTEHDRIQSGGSHNPGVISQNNLWTEFHIIKYCPEDPMSYVTEHDRIQSGGSHELCHRT